MPAHTELYSSHFDKIDCVIWNRIRGISSGLIMMFTRYQSKSTHTHTHTLIISDSIARPTIIYMAINRY